MTKMQEMQEKYLAETEAEDEKEKHCRDCVHCDDANAGGAYESLHCHYDPPNLDGYWTHIQSNRCYCSHYITPERARLRKLLAVAGIAKGLV